MNHYAHVKRMAALEAADELNARGLEVTIPEGPMAEDRQRLLAAPPEAEDSGGVAQVENKKTKARSMKRRRGRPKGPNDADDDERFRECMKDYPGDTTAQKNDFVVKTEKKHNVDSKTAENRYYAARKRVVG
jgi:hypothetical protein